MSKRIGFLLGGLALSGVLAWGSEELSSRLQAQLAQLSQLRLAQTGGIGDFSRVDVKNESGALVMQAGWQDETTAFTNRGDGAILVSDFNGNARVLVAAVPTLSGAGTVGEVGVFDAGGNVTAIMSAEVGFVSDRGDIAEHFESSERSIEPGSVMVLDPENPGSLKRSSRAYDRRVAGVASGAQNYRPGMMLGSRDRENAVPVTLTGTVYCKVTTTNGAIQAGDLLTTSGVPGYAMRATDPAQSQGAILGKAMQDFDGVSGVILILASLQ
jgi:hypothetical protein